MGSCIYFPMEYAYNQLLVVLGCDYMSIDFYLLRSSLLSCKRINVIA